jgi:flagellar motor switch protein FliG
MLNGLMTTGATVSLTPIQKIAVLVATLDQEISATVLQRLKPDVIEQVAGAVRHLGIIPGALREACIGECLQGVIAMGDSISADDDTATALLTKAIGEKRAAVMMGSGGDDKPPFAALADASADQIAAVLSREQPRIAAAVLPHLKHSLSAEVLGLLSSESRRQAIVFMCQAAPPSHEVLASLEAFMTAKIGRGENKRKIDDSDKIEIVASILQTVERSVEDELLTAIDESSEALGSDIRDRLFTFEDVIKLDDPTVRRILQEIDTAALGIALRKASVDLREKFFTNMSKRAAEGLKEEMQFAQKIRLSDIEAKQKEIVNAVRGLETAGEIKISGGGDDDEFV